MNSTPGIHICSAGLSAAVAFVAGPVVAQSSLTLQGELDADVAYASNVQVQLSTPTLNRAVLARGPAVSTTPNDHCSHVT